MGAGGAGVQLWGVGGAHTFTLIRKEVTDEPHRPVQLLKRNGHLCLRGSRCQRRVTVGTPLHELSQQCRRGAGVEPTHTRYKLHLRGERGREFNRYRQMVPHGDAEHSAYACVCVCVRVRV